MRGSHSENETKIIDADSSTFQQAGHEV